MIVRSVARESRMASRGGAQVAGDQREVGGLDGDVGAGADREAEVGLGERGRVVDAVADHRDDAAFALQAADHVRLVGGHDLGDDLVDADLGGDGASGRLVVAGQQDRAQPERFERGDRLGGAVA